MFEYYRVRRNIVTNLRQFPPSPNTATQILNFHEGLDGDSALVPNKPFDLQLLDWKHEAVITHTRTRNVLYFIVSKIYPSAITGKGKA